MAFLNLRQIVARRSSVEWVIFAGLLAGSLCVGNRLSSGTSWINARAKIYQTLTVFARNGRLPQRTAVVRLDDTDYWTQTFADPTAPELAGRAPTNRKYLAKLIDALVRAHVGLIVLDIDLRSPNPQSSEYDLPEYKPEDDALFDSISRACAQHHQIVLASELVTDKGVLAVARNIYDQAGLPESCVHNGYIELPSDIRRVPATLSLASNPEVNSLSLAAVKAVDLNAYHIGAAEGAKDFPYSEFLPLTSFSSSGAEQTLFSGREIQAPDPTGALTAKLLNRIVLVGADWHTLALGQGPWADRHPSPASDLPGVILHANYIEFCSGVGTSQSFGLPLMKSKTTLQRKLPALVQLPAGTVNIVVTGHSDASELTIDFRSMLGSQLLKEDPRLSITGQRGDSTISCAITAFDHPASTTSTRPGVQTGKTTAKPITYTRVTGLMRVSFQAKSRSGKTIGSDNILAKYDEEFDTSGNSLSSGITGAFKNGVNRIKGGKSEEMNPPTDEELKTKLVTSAVNQIVVELVNTRETIEVLLAKGKSPLDEGVKDAEGGLWSRALEVWGTMPPLPRPVDDAYRLYDLGVANEALAYASEDYQSATKFLDEAAIDYGKAIDSNPAEKYFIEPQKRIESALAHYHKLESQSHPAPAEPVPAVPTHKKNAQNPSGG